MVREFKNLTMEIFTRGFMWMANLVVLESTIGQMAVISKEISKMDSEMDMGCGREGLAIVISTRDSILTIKSQDMAFLHGQVETFTKETMEMIVEMAMVKCTGMMEASIRDSGKMEYNMEKEKSMCLDQAIRKAPLKIMCLSSLNNSHSQ